MLFHELAQQRNGLVVNAGLSRVEGNGDGFLLGERGGHGQNHGDGQQEGKKLLHHSLTPFLFFCEKSTDWLHKVYHARIAMSIA